MDGVASWKNAGAGFAPSVTPSLRRSTPASSTASTSRPRPSSSKQPRRAPHKQPLLFSRDKTPLITPRDSSSSKRPTPVQSKLSTNSFSATSNRRKPLAEKQTNHRGGTNRTNALVVDNDDDDDQKGQKADSEYPKSKTGRTTRINSSDSSTEDAQVSKALLSSVPSSKWKGQLSRRPSNGDDAVGPIAPSRSATVARQILNPTNRKRGPTIEFDRDDVASDDDEMRGESQRRKRKRIDRGSFGRLDLVTAGGNGSDPDEEEEQDTRNRSRIDSQRKRRRSRLEGHEIESPAPTRRPSQKRFESQKAPYVLGRLPPPRPSGSGPRSQHRSVSMPSSGSTASAEDIQARLVPLKKPVRILCPDSDEVTPPSESDHEGEEPETEADDEEIGIKRKIASAGKARVERSDDSGFAEVIDLCHSSSPPPLPPSSHAATDGDLDDLESVPDSQPSVASHLSHALGSSPPRPRSRSSSSVTVLEPISTIARPTPRHLRPTESAILMPPPPLKRLRRGPPPRNRFPSPPPPLPIPSSSRTLVEDTQPCCFFEHPSFPFQTSQSNPYRIFCEETQTLPPQPQQQDDDSVRPLTTTTTTTTTLMMTEQEEAEERLRLWNELNTRLPSDLPELDSDQIVLPDPTKKSLRPLKHLDVSPLPSPPPPPPPRLGSSAVHSLEEEKEPEQEGGLKVVEEEEEEEEEEKTNRRRRRQAAATVTGGGGGGDWTSLESAWRGSKPISPPQPLPPRQSRLTEHFTLPRRRREEEEEEEKEEDEGEKDVVVEDSQIGFPALERAVRDSIHGFRGGGGGGRLRVVHEKDVDRSGQILEEEEEEVCSSPLSSLSPSLPPSSPPLEQTDVEMHDDAEARDEEEEVVPDSEPEDCETSVSMMRGGLGPCRFPRYELPKCVVDFDSKAFVDSNEEEEVRRVQDTGFLHGEGEADEGGGGESMWESYWTVGSAPQPDREEYEAQEEEEEDEESAKKATTSKTVAEMLLEQAPELELPAGWHEDGDGNLIRGEFRDVGSDEE